MSSGRLRGRILATFLRNPFIKVRAAAEEIISGSESLLRDSRALDCCKSSGRPDSQSSGRNLRRFAFEIKRHKQAVLCALEPDRGSRLKKPNLCRSPELLRGKRESGSVGDPKLNDNRISPNIRVTQVGITVESCAVISSTALSD